MLKKCSKEDLPDLLKMGQKFCEAVKFEFDKKVLSNTLNNLISNGICIRTEKGCIGGLVYPMFMSGELVAQEFFWWSEDNNGKVLLDEFEKIAKDMGAKKIIMVSLAKSDYNRVSSIYDNRGYEFLEPHYIKEL